MKFRQKVVPGDTLIFHRIVHDPHAPWHGRDEKAVPSWGEKVVCECEFMAQIIKNK